MRNIPQFKGKVTFIHDLEKDIIKAYYPKKRVVLTKIELDNLIQKHFGFRKSKYNRCFVNRIISEKSDIEIIEMLEKEVQQ